MTVDAAHRFNLAEELLDHHINEGSGDRPAILFRDQTWTYADIQRLANRVGSALRGLGTRIEERVLILVHDSPQFAACLFGAIKIGAVAVPVNTMLSPDDYLAIANDCRARVAFCEADVLPRFSARRQDMTFLRHLVVMNGEGGDLSFERLTAGSDDDCTPAPTCRDDAAFWQYSSGTTGRPKGVIHLHHDMIYSADLFARGVLGIGPGDRTFSVSRLFFGYGLGNGLCFPFRVGASTVLVPDRPTPDRIVDMVRRCRPTLFFGVPTAYAALLERDLLPTDWSSVRVCLSSGEALPTAVGLRWRDRLGLDIIDCLGSTEALHVFICNRPGDAVPGSIGRPVPGYEAKIVDDELRELPPGQTGQLMIRGDSIAAGYWNRHQRTQKTFLGPWLLTGDQLQRDEDGRFWFAGRSDDMLKVGGIWVAPAEVESEICHHPAVSEAAIVGWPDERGMQKPKAFVVLREGFTASPELALEIARFVKGRLAPYKYPRWVQFVEELPRTATGKIQRFLLREEAGK